MVKILGISGSLRKDSANTRLLELAADCLPDSATLDIHSIGWLPLYNQDDDGDEKPVPVVELKTAVSEADALLIVTPEYNYGVPGVLKNALDWASRPAYKSPLAHKPAGIMSASASPIGGIRAQGQLKQILLGTLTPVYPAPEFCLPSALDAFDTEGRLRDSGSQKRLERYVEGFVDWVRGGF